jgi:hypothetical protein
MARPIVETFNTHRMQPEVIRRLSTGREDPLADILETVRRALANPAGNAQHRVVYGERGSGKSFLMRLVELDVAALAAQQDAPVTMVLLPEEQYNIRSEAQLLEALAAALDGDAAGFAFTYDSREAQTAWDQARRRLDAALDRRFGAGRGLLIAGVENFDTLSRQLFGTGKKAKTKVAAEQRAAEERLRLLLNDPGSRLLLLATATRTVDMDYERPLFRAFLPVDLRPWSDDAASATSTAAAPSTAPNRWTWRRAPAPAPSPPSSAATRASPSCSARSWARRRPAPSPTPWTP